MFCHVCHNNYLTGHCFLPLWRTLCVCCQSSGSVAIVYLGIEKRFWVQFECCGVPQIGLFSGFSNLPVFGKTTAFSGVDENVAECPFLFLQKP